MSSIPLLPNLSTWAQNRLTAIFQATTQDDFDLAYENFVAKQVHITVNGKHVSRADYKTQLWQEKGLESGAEVSYPGTVEVPGTDGELSGLVGLFLQATVAEKLLVFGAPETKSVNSSYNLTIALDSTLQHPGGPINHHADDRRVSVLNKVSVGKQDPIVPPHGSQTTSS
ncbi:hypothetical protein PHLCEN_2v8205 [Hermanssonia centrifuga]|uniref:Uncharacterized protein n=1 Tax=Hermanssonia centrifuga TaxID=98765 RepID=A0A2R6NUG5_9APHY|nr:hypothetical protein PHLCEN_2v8205 [Hermanssonia centrifuga]